MPLSARDDNRLINGKQEISCYDCYDDDNDNDGGDGDGDGGYDVTSGVRVRFEKERSQSRFAGVRSRHSEYANVNGSQCIDHEKSIVEPEFSSIKLRYNEGNDRDVEKENRKSSFRNIERTETEIVHRLVESRLRNFLFFSFLSAISIRWFLKYEGKNK